MDVGCNWLLVALVVWVALLNTIHGWRVVFKVVQGTATNVNGLWLSSDSLGDTEAGYAEVKSSYWAPEYPNYKSSIVNNWAKSNISEVKVNLYKAGTAVVSVVFKNKLSDDRTSWFDKNNIQTLYPNRYEDMKADNVQVCRITVGGGRSFQIGSNSATDCKTMAGWMIIEDTDSAGQCQWDNSSVAGLPLFRYAQNDTQVKFFESDVAEVFVIFVDDCVVNPCLFGGKCTNVMGNAQCQCTEHRYGSRCEESRPCISQPCQNGGTCKDGTGRSDFSCLCDKGYHGDTCQFHEEGEGSGSIGAKIAIGVCVPVIIILIGVFVGYCIYIKRNPDGYGRATTIKHMALARDFVRRSFRRLSRRKSNPNKRETTKDNTQIIPKTDAVGMSHVNLGFREGDDEYLPKWSPGVQDADYIDLSPSDQAVVSGGHESKFKYPNNKPHSASQNLHPFPKSLSPHVKSNADHYQISSYSSDSSGLGSPRYSDPEQPASGRYTPDSNSRYMSENRSPMYKETSENKTVLNESRDGHNSKIGQNYDHSYEIQNSQNRSPSVHPRTDNRYRLDSRTHEPATPVRNREYEQPTPADRYRNRPYNSPEPTDEIGVSSAAQSKEWSI